MLPVRIGLEVIMLVGVIAIFEFAGKTLQNQENQHNYTTSQGAGQIVGKTGGGAFSEREGSFRF